MALKLIICFGLFILTVGIAFSMLTRPYELRSIISPSNKYSVQLTERRVFPYIDSEGVYLNASSGDKFFLKEKLLYTGDFMDDDFMERYPNFRWLSESVLKIGQRQDRQSDKLKVSNKTQFQLKYLLIETYRDKFVILDVQPYETVDLPFSYNGRLSVQGEFSTGERFAEAVELVNKEVNREEKEFSVDVFDDKVNIDDPNEKLDRVKCCAVDRSSFDRE